MADKDSRAAAAAAFAEVATSDEKAQVAVVEQSVASVVLEAQSVLVRSDREAEQAVNLLARIAGEKKRAEEARKFLVKPLNDHVKAINERFRESGAPLDEADALVRPKVIAYRAEQERARQAEQARLDAEQRERERAAEDERRRQEAEARAAREAAAREAHRAEQEALAAEKRRREQMEREQDERAQWIAAQSDDALRALADNPREQDEIRDSARGELAARREAREAQERVAAARQAEEDARALEEAQRTAPLPEQPRAVVAPAPRLSASSGSAAERKRWVAEVVDPGSVPRKYLKVDEAAINRAVREGVRAIPGVRIQQVSELAVKAR